LGRQETEEKKKETSPRLPGSSKLLMNRIDEFYFLAIREVEGYTGGLRASGSPERKSL
jgi:hypothetical protein